MRWTSCALIVLVAAFAVAGPANTARADRPNILWITAEDMSQTLGCYGDAYAITPNLDKLASESVLYTNGFATAPVCSPSRSCLINGTYSQSQGTQHMRSAFPLPDYMRGFPSFLRDVGYYTTNNVKTDYNSGSWDAIIKASWDDSSDTATWRNNPDKSRPFFSIFNLMTSHQSRTMVWPYEKFVAEVQSKLTSAEIHDPASAPVPPYYPDTPVVRRTIARFYDCVTAMDKEVGAILKQLEDDGLAEDTIVFFYSDHGSGMPRHKRALFDTGTKVAMMIRVPNKWKHLVPAAFTPGAKIDQLVSFVDFGPTVLSLAGVDIPEWMQGKPFLGPKASWPREFVYCHRDRVDEVSDMARSVRDKRYLYIRNYMPHLSYNQPTAWPDLSEIRHEFYRLAQRDKMTDAQWQFAGPTRRAEELYDCVEDPLNLHNLVGSREHAEVLLRMRAALKEHLATTADLGFMPEAQQWQRVEASGMTAWELGERALHKTGVGDDVAKTYNQDRAVAAASMVRLRRETDIVMHLEDPDPTVRYWAAVAMNARTSISKEGFAALTKALQDGDISVRCEAADALARHDHVDGALPVLIAALDSKNLAAVLYAARAIELLGDKAAAAEPAMKALDTRMKGMRPADIPATVVQPGDLDMAMFIGFATQAFLNR